MSFSELNNALAVQKRLYRGYGKIAKQQGLLTGVYRPVNALAPFDNKISELFVIYTKDFNFKKLDKFGVPLMIGMFDGTGIQEGDYLVTPPEPNTLEYVDADVFTKTGIVGRCDYFYVASMQSNSPVLLIECQRTISVSCPTGPVGASGATKGKLGYSGSTRATETLLMANIKASIQQGTKGETNPANLPLDIRMPWWTITFPAISGVVIDTGYFIRDDLGRKYVVSSPELTDMGWRISASYERV